MRLKQVHCYEHCSPSRTPGCFEPTGLREHSTGHRDYNYTRFWVEHAKRAPGKKKAITFFSSTTNSYNTGEHFKGVASATTTEPQTAKASRTQHQGWTEAKIIIRSHCVQTHVGYLLNRILMTVQAYFSKSSKPTRSGKKTPSQSLFWQ